MIDRRKRDKLAESLRHLLSGTMKNLDFDSLASDGTVRSGDPAIRVIFRRAWYFYDDFHNHPVEVSDGVRRDVARWIVFLHSDLNYEWPHGSRAFLAPVLSVWHQIFRNQEPTAGEKRYWPFFRKEDYLNARRHPRLLAGGFPSPPTEPED